MISIFSFLFLSLVASAFPVDDPKDFLTTDVGPQMQVRDFDEAFSCGQKVKFQQFTASCSVSCNFACMSRCEEAHTNDQRNFELEIADCSSDLIHIYGTNGLSMEVSRGEFEVHGYNWLLAYLRNLDLFLTPVYRIEISDWPSFGHRKVTKVVNGKKVELETIKVEGSYYSHAATGSLNFTALLDPKGVGLEQLLYFEVGGPGGDVFLKQNGVVYDPFKNF